MTQNTSPYLFYIFVGLINFYWDIYETFFKKLSIFNFKEGFYNNSYSRYKKIEKFIKDKLVRTDKETLV